MSLASDLTQMDNTLTALLEYANGVTGASDVSVGDAIHTLGEGYGGGGGSTNYFEITPNANYELVVPIALPTNYLIVFMGKTEPSTSEYVAFYGMRKNGITTTGNRILDYLITYKLASTAISEWTTTISTRIAITAGSGNFRIKVNSTYNNYPVRFDPNCAYKVCVFNMD